MITLLLLDRIYVFLFVTLASREYRICGNGFSGRKKTLLLCGGITAVSMGILLCVALCAVIMTVVKTGDTRQVELSAPEVYTVDQEAGTILVPMENVSDGHLHRFEYRTDKNIDVRWIVVKKPNSAAFGVGLDACEVCGNAGYFERNGQIICKRCDVVMNINTIGFKGGCNPIPMPYEVKDGNLIFRLSDIIAGEKEFR